MIRIRMQINLAHLPWRVKINPAAHTIPTTGPDTTLQPGDLVVQGSPGEGQFFTPLGEFENSGGTLDEYNNGQQIEPNPNYGPRQGVTVYQVVDPTAAAESQALANTSAGPGGWTQYFVPGGPDNPGLCAIYCIPFKP